MSSGAIDQLNLDSYNTPRVGVCIALGKSVLPAR